MIIKGLFGRYERWNPVHPTFGAFWGMGLGVGCGVGWGPGFGPEVVGYVGAGCGVGFNVGITLAGIGIGLPANSLYKVPYNAALATRSRALGLAHSSGLLSSKSVAADGLNGVGPYITVMDKEVRGWFSRLKQNHFFSNWTGSSDMKSLLPFNPNSICDGLGTIRARFLQHHKGAKD